MPPSKVKRNRQRLAKFLEKPETQPDLPPITSCERSREGEEISAPPLITSFEPCNEEGLEFDTASVAESEAPHSSMQTKSSITCKDSEHSGQREEEKGKGEKMDRTNIEKSSDREDMIVGDNESGLEDTEDEVETESELDSLPGDTPVWARAYMTEIRSIGAKIATKKDFEPIKDNVNEFKSRMEMISTTQEGHEDHEDVQPVRAVRVPAHQVSDRKFVKVERKRRRRKNHPDCKTS